MAQRLLFGGDNELLLYKSAHSYQPLEQHSLLATKWHIPPTRSLVARPHLNARLNQGIQHKLTLLSAPTGFGKTTLLSAWAQYADSPIAWLSLDKGDNDLIRFWYYMIEALETLCQGVGKHALALLHAPQSPTFDSILTTLINALTAIPDDFFLILDDYHLIDNSTIHETMTFLLDHLPLHMHLIIASRTYPSLPLSRLRAWGQLIELHTTDLLFTCSEATIFFKQVMGLNLPVDVVAELQKRTEGWIAGLQLTALSLQRCDDVSAFVSAFSGSHRYILDYLTDEVFCQQPAAVQTFLLHTAILERLNASLCNALTTQQDGQSMLERLEQANLFLIPLDEERRWYRYSQLFGDFLRNHLQQTQPDLVPVLYRRASMWCEQNNLLVEAIEYSLAAADFERAASLIEWIGKTFERNGEGNTLLRWLDIIPDDLVQSAPQLCLFRAWSLAINGQLTNAGVWLQHAKNSLRASRKAHVRKRELVEEIALPMLESDDRDEINNLLGEIFALDAYISVSQGDITNSVELSSQALNYLSAHNLFMRSIVTSNLGFVYSLCGDVAAASRAFTEASVLSQTMGNSYITLLTLCSLAMMQGNQGRLHAAADIYRQALHLTTEKGHLPAPYACMAYIGMGGLLYEWHELEQATHHLMEGIELSKQWGNREYLIYGCSILAVVKQAQGDSEEARALIAQANEQTKGYQVPIWVTPVLAAYQIRLQLMQGNVEGASEMVQKCSLGDFEYATQARIYIAQHQPDKALELLEQQLPLLESSGQLRKTIEFRMLQALACYQRNDLSQSLLALQQSLSLAEPEGYIRLFVDEGELMALLLSRLLNQYQRKNSAILSGFSAHYNRKLLQILSGYSETSTSQKRGQGLLQTKMAHLTEREIELMRCISSGMSNDEIAQQWVVARSTVLWHIKNIYGKLHIHNRAQVIIRAKELGLAQ